MTIGDGYTIVNSTITGTKYSSLLNLQPLKSRPRVVATYQQGQVNTLLLGMANSDTWEEDQSVLREFILSILKPGLRNAGSATLIMEAIFPGDEPDYSIEQTMNLKFTYNVDVKQSVTLKSNRLSMNGAANIQSYLNSASPTHDGELIIKYN